MKNYHIKYTFRCPSGVIHHIETPQMELPNDDWYFEHKATVVAMKILLEMARENKIAFKELIDYQIIWEE